MPRSLHSDEELMCRVSSTLDETALRELMERHHAKALGYIQKKVFCRQLAEEIVQDSFIRVVRNRNSFDSSKKFSTWFYAILKNRSIDALRQRQRHESKLEKFAVHTAVFPQRPLADPIPVFHLLQDLRADDRSLLVDHFIYGMTFPELAEKLGLPKETLKKRAQRTIQKIRKALRAQPLNDEPFFRRPTRPTR